MTPPLIRYLLPVIAATSSVLAYAGEPLVCLIQPSQVAEVGTSVIGVIEGMRVERGDYVKKGGVIAVLRNDVERAALDVARSKAQAEADVQAAIAGLDYARQRQIRAEDLFNRQFISEQALDQTRTEAQVAEQKLAQAREQRRIWEREMGLAQSQLAQRTILSPISGIVAERYLSAGERVEDRSVARVVSIDPLYVEVMVPAAQFGRIKTGMMATVMPELPDTAPVHARVSLVDKIVDGASNTFRVRLNLPNPKHSLPAGLRCKADLGLKPIVTADGLASRRGVPHQRYVEHPSDRAALKCTIARDCPLNPVAGFRRRPLIEELEPRLLFSADFAPTLLDNPIPASEQRVLGADGEFANSTDYQDQAQHSRLEVVFIDLRVDNYQQILADIQKQNGGGRAIEVVLIDSQHDGIAQIGQFLDQHRNIDAIHIISHGSDGSIQLGSTSLDTSALQQYAAQIHDWGNAFKPGADILLYGCDVAADQTGKAFVDKLAQLTGADMAASTDLTGSASLGGNWQFEYRDGKIETAVALDAAAQASWKGTLGRADPGPGWQQ